MTTPEPDLPDLEFPAPDCPLCDRETHDNDGMFDCEPCNLTWSADGTHGERQNRDVPRCPAQCSPHDKLNTDGAPRWPALHGRRYECVLDAEHVRFGLPHQGVTLVESMSYIDNYEWPLTKAETEALK